MIGYRPEEECLPLSALRWAEATLLLIDPGWRSATVLDLARAIEEMRAYDRMPILADALEEAGCDNDDLLVHCRDCPAHRPGCWVVAALLRRPRRPPPAAEDTLTIVERRRVEVAVKNWWPKRSQSGQPQQEAPSFLDRINTISEWYGYVMGVLVIVFGVCSLVMLLVLAVSTI